MRTFFALLTIVLLTSCQNPRMPVLRGRAGRLLRYDIAIEPQTESAVTFASLAID